MMIAYMHLCVCVRMCECVWCMPMPQYVCVGQRTNCGNHFCPFTMWILVTEHRSSGLEVSDFTCSAVLQTGPVLHFE